jgi:intracellular multiplication protein IcmC
MSWSFDPQLFINNMYIVADIVQDFSIAAGLTLFFLGLMKFKRYGEMRTFMSTQMTMAAPLMLTVCGALLVAAPQLIGTALYAFWGQVSPLQYQGGGISVLNQLVKAIIIFVRVLGLCVFIRGFIMLAKSGGEGGQPGMRGKALMHLFIGVLMIHFLGTEHLLMEVLGFSSA